MTPTPKEKQWLHDYLYQTMQYRETFEEVYDHVLLALEDEPRLEFFATSAMGIINRDFGADGLPALEENCRESVDEMATIQFKDNFRCWFAPPRVLFTATFFVAIIYLELSPVKTGIMLATFFVVLLILPVIICSVRGARMGYTFGANKESIKDKIFRSLAYKANRILFNMLLISTWAQSITSYLFNLNNYLSLLVGLLSMMLLIWPHLRQYRRKQKGLSYQKLKLIPRTEKLFLGWYIFLTFAVDAITKFVTNSNDTTQSGSSPSIIAISLFDAVMAAILVLMVINVLATIKLYRSEFKTTMVRG